MGLTYTDSFDITQIYKYITEKKQVYTYSYTFQVIKYLKLNDYVKTRKNGRRTFIELTNKGKRLSERIHYIIEELQYKR
jgi:predicted transcriptional regulator